MKGNIIYTIIYKNNLKTVKILIDTLNYWGHISGCQQKLPVEF